MKYRPEIYAKAFALAAEKNPPAGGAAEQEKKIIRNLLALVRRNGDAKDLPKITSHAEKILREKEGRKKFLFESARPIAQELRKSLLGMLREKDVTEEKVVPDLVAGVRVTVDEERQFDATLARKLQKMFA